MHRNKGLTLLLEVLGGLVVALLIHFGHEFIEYLKIVSTCEGIAPITLFVVLGYLAYVGNVFRQVHGLAVALEDGKLDQITDLMTRFERIGSFVCLMLVLSFPLMLVVHINCAMGQQRAAH